MRLFCLSVFLLFPSAVFAWNSMCHSPVQLAAFMSKPKKKGSNLKKLRKEERTLEKSINKLEERMDEQVDKLADSLDDNKLGQDTSSKVASEIKSYIENKRNSWDCPEAQSNLLFHKFLKTPGAFWPSESPEGLSYELSSPSLMFPSPWLFSSSLFIPPAVAKKQDGASTSAVVKSGRSFLQRQCEQSGGEWQIAPNTTSFCVCPSSRNLKLDSDGKQCVCLDNTMTKIETNGQKRCLPIESNKKKACEDSGGRWSNPDSSGSASCDCSEQKGLKREGTECICLNSQMDSSGSGSDTKCECKKGFFLSGTKCIRKGIRELLNNETLEKKCKESGGEWTEGPDGIISCDCSDKKGLKQEGDKCVCSDENTRYYKGLKKCTSQDFRPPKKNARFDEYLKKKEQECATQSRVWNPHTNKCCDEGEELFNQQCQENNTRQATKGVNSLVSSDSDVGDIQEESVPKPDCPDWKEDKAFKSKGKVDPEFCVRYATNNRDCERALKRIKTLAKQISNKEDAQDELGEKISKARSDSRKNFEEETEAGALCFNCLKRILKAGRPSTGETIGNVLTMLAGAGIGAAGYNFGKRAQYDANMLRIQQGYTAQNDNYHLMGASAGFPYVAQGLYGLTRANTPVGGWSCSPAMSSYGHSYNYQYGQGFNMRYY